MGLGDAAGLPTSCDLGLGLRVSLVYNLVWESDKEGPSSGPFPNVAIGLPPGAALGGRSPEGRCVQPEMTTDAQGATACHAPPRSTATCPQSPTVVSLLKFHKTGEQVTLLLGKIRGRGGGGV